MASTAIPAKIEGITFGQDVTFDGSLYHTLFVANDNDFVPAVAGPSRFYVFGFTDNDLAGFVPQRLAAAVPEPGTLGDDAGGVRRNRPLLPQAADRDRCHKPPRLDCRSVAEGAPQAMRGPSCVGGK